MTNKIPATHYAYAFYKTRESAEFALEALFACGEIFECDDPIIIKRGARCYIVAIRDGLYAY